jgi:hypothetical protein
MNLERFAKILEIIKEVEDNAEKYKNPELIIK